MDIEYDGLLRAAHHLTQINDGAHICRGRVQAGGGGGHLKPVSWSEKEPFLSDSPHTELLTPEMKMTSQRSEGDAVWLISCSIGSEGSSTLVTLPSEAGEWTDKQGEDK